MILNDAFSIDLVFHLVEELKLWEKSKLYQHISPQPMLRLNY